VIVTNKPVLGKTVRQLGFEVKMRCVGHAAAAWRYRDDGHSGCASAVRRRAHYRR
jgi:hypothetical protein